MIAALLSRKEEKYLSWEEYKKRLIEVRVIQLIETFMKKDSRICYTDLNNIRISTKIGGDKYERNIFQ